MLFNQFHDILAGTSLEPAYDDARDLYGEAASIASRNMNYAIQSISWRIDVEQKEGMKPIVVFNPHSWPSKVNVELEFGKLGGEETLLDCDKHQVPMQTVQSQAASPGRNRLNFVADLPAMGYRVYRVVPHASWEDIPSVRANDTSAENERLRLKLDPETGFIVSLYDKSKGVEVFEAPAARPVVLEDPSDTWSHGVVRYDDEIETFSVGSVGLVEHGPVKAVLPSGRVRSRRSVFPKTTIGQLSKQICSSGRPIMMIGNLSMSEWAQDPIPSWAATSE